MSYSKEDYRATIATDNADIALATSMWSKTLAGTGAVSVLSGHSRLELGIVAVSRVGARIFPDDTLFNFWDMSPTFNIHSLVFTVLAADGTYNAYAITGADGTFPGGTDQYMGFKVEVVAGVATLYSVHNNNGTETKTSIAGITLTDAHSFAAIMRSGVGIDFYVDGVYKTTHTTNLPTGLNNEAIFNYVMERIAGGGTNDQQMFISPSSISYKLIK